MNVQPEFYDYGNVTTSKADKLHIYIFYFNFTFATTPYDSLRLFLMP